MIISADFGGTRIKYGFIDESLEVNTRIIPSYANLPSSEWLPLFYRDILSYAESLSIDISKVKGMVWAVPLVVHPSLKFATREFGKFKDLTKPDFCDQAETVFKMPLLLENDARAALIGEAHYGNGRNFDNVGIITLGTGIGTAVTIDGIPFRGKRGSAGNMDGISITHAETSASDIYQNRLESHIASWAIKDLCKSEKFNTSSLKDQSELDYYHVFTEANKGDSFAIEIRDKAIRGWQSIALNMIYSYDLDCLIFGGGIMKSYAQILPHIDQIIAQDPYLKNHTVKVDKSLLEEDAALLGNYWLWSSQ